MAHLEASNILRVDGMVAVVTGGGSGIGWMMAEALAVNGAKKVYILGRRLDVLQEAAAKYPDNMAALQCDVTSRDSLQSAVDTVAQEVGYVNLVVANSGVSGPAVRYDPSKPLSEVRRALWATPMEDFTETFHVNVAGAFYTMVAFLELLDAGNRHAVSGAAGAFGAPDRQGGRVPSIQSQVVFTSSVAAFLRSYYSSPAYAGSKTAIMHLMKQVASQLAPYGIRANALAPGLFPSVMAAALIGNRDPEEETIQDAAFIPVQKFGGDREMSGAILYLVSRAGSFTNGMVLLNDGGRSAMIPATY